MDKEETGHMWASLVAQMVKNPSACNVGDLGSIPGLGGSPAGGHGNPLQYSCLENPYGQRSLSTGFKELNMIEQLSTHYTHTMEYYSDVKKNEIQGRKWQLTPEFLPEKSHGQRSLVVYNPWS